MKAFTYALRHRADKTQWTMGPLFTTFVKAQRAAHEFKVSRSEKYSKVLVFECNAVVDWTIQEPAPKPHGTRHKSHKPAGKK